MRRVIATLLSASFIIICGCGKGSYDKRIDITLDNLKYQSELNKKLAVAPAATDGKFHDLAIYLRPPKGEAYVKTFFLGEPTPGLFDLTESFTDKATGHSLHTIARVKQPKKTPTKGQPAPTEEPVVARGEFGSDVLAFLQQVYGSAEEIQPAKLKSESKKGNAFKKLSFVTVGANNASTTVQVFIMKKDAHDVALVFVMPTADLAKQLRTIDLCLESFAVGAKAKTAYSGGELDEAGESVGGGEGANF